MKTFKYLLLFLINLTLIQTSTLNAKIVFHGGYVFETFKGQKVSAAYVSLFNQLEQDVVIKKIETDICDRAEIHETFMENDIMKMRKVSSIKVKKKSELYFQPGGTHIMLMGLNKELIPGSSFKIYFEFDNEQTAEVEIKVLDKKLRENLLDNK